MSGNSSMKAKEFEQFRNSVLQRVRGRDGKQLYDPDSNMDSFYLNTAEKSSEEREVKINVRFLARSSHFPVVHLSVHDFAPNPKDIKKRCGVDKTDSSSGSHSASFDSVLHGVCVALDYDKDTISKLSQ